MQLLSNRVITFTLSLGLILMVVASTAVAQHGYQLTNLVSNLSGKAQHTDPLLANPWGLTYGPGTPFWVSDEASGWSTLYNAQGNPQSLQVVIPSASGTGKGTPTGIVYNASQEFKIQTWRSVFLFATLDGTISGWSSFSPSQALIGAKQSGAVYTGLAITSKTSGNFLYAADSVNNRIDIYNGSFSLVKSFTDSAIPAGFAPFGIQDISGQLYVTFASTSGGSGGYIDIFGEDGTFVKRFAQGAPLNQPWGLAVAPRTFGIFSGALLVTNNTPSGTINAFNLTTGKALGTLKTTTGKVITIPGVWGISFGGGTVTNGKANQLFFTAGPGDKDGYFGAIVAK